MILSKASLVRSPGRLGPGLRHLAVALAVVAFASGTASAQHLPLTDYTRVGNLNQHNSGFNPAADANGNYATVDGYATDNGSSTTINFLVSATNPDYDIVSFSFNSEDETLEVGDFDVFAITETSSGISLTSIKSQVGLEKNVSEAGLFTYRLNFSSNDTQKVLIEFTADGDNVVLGDFVVANTAGNTFAAHLKTPGSTGFVFSTSNGIVPEPASIVMVSMSSLMGLGYAWRKRKRAVA